MAYEVAKIRGLSGELYELQIFSKWTRFEENLSAVYVFLAEDKEKYSEFRILYIGQSEDLDRRLLNHHKWGEAIRRGFSHLGVLPLPTNQLDRVERDLVRFHEPELNEVLYQGEDS